MVPIIQRSSERFLLSVHLLNADNSKTHVYNIPNRAYSNGENSLVVSSIAFYTLKTLSKKVIDTNSLSAADANNVDITIQLILGDSV